MTDDDHDALMTAREMSTRKLVCRIVAFLVAIMLAGMFVKYLTIFSELNTKGHIATWVILCAGSLVSGVFWIWSNERE